MTLNSQTRSILRLFGLVVILGGLYLLTTDKKIFAGTCDTEYGECIYSSCAGLTGQALETCINTCSLSYEYCRLEEEEETNQGCTFTRNPLYSPCMVGCGEYCSSLPEPGESIECASGCKASCPEPWKATCY